MMVTPATTHDRPLADRCSRFAVACCIASCLIAFSPAAFADQIRLATGEVLTVELREVTAESVRFVHPVLGEITIPRDAVTLLDEPRPDAAPAPAPAPTDEPPIPAPDAPEEEHEPEWSFRLTLAGSYATGNTENANIASRFRARRETELNRLTFDAGYFFGSSDGQRTENHFTAGFRHDWLLPDSRWFIFADGRYDFDEFQSWEHRASGHVGVGYELLHRPPLDLNLLAGIGAIREWGSDNEQIRPEALGGFEGLWEIAERHTLEFSSIAFLDLRDFGEFRWVNSLGWSYLLDNRTNLSLTAGLEHEYQSIVDPGRKRHDLRLFAGVQMDF